MTDDDGPFADDLRYGLSTAKRLARGVAVPASAAGLVPEAHSRVAKASGMTPPPWIPFRACQRRMWRHPPHCRKHDDTSWVTHSSPDDLTLPCIVTERRSWAKGLVFVEVAEGGRRDLGSHGATDLAEADAQAERIAVKGEMLIVDGIAVPNRQCNGWLWSQSITSFRRASCSRSGSDISRASGLPIATDFSVNGCPPQARIASRSFPELVAPTRRVLSAFAKWSHSFSFRCSKCARRSREARRPARFPSTSSDQSQRRTR